MKYLFPLVYYFILSKKKNDKALKKNVLLILNGLSYF